MKVIADEEKRVCNKFDYINGILGSKKKEIQSLSDQIEMALTEGDDVLFLKVMCPVNANPILRIARTQDHKSAVVVLVSDTGQLKGDAVVCKNLL